MPYSINKSDPNNQIPIIVPDFPPGLNTADTSLKLIGRNYPNFGHTIAENFVHLLENFSSPTPPNNPTSGQLWYNTADISHPNLYVFNGTSWAPTNGVFQTDTDPYEFSSYQVRLGDIWINTKDLQLSIFDGAGGWILIGPNLAASTKTGSYPTQLRGTDGTDYSVILMYLDNEIMEIIASAQFTPVSIIDGFTNIVPGINISNKIYDTYSPKFAGVASSALTLRQTTPTLEDVSANNFIRNDIDQSINGTLIINNNLGIQIGNSSPTFSLAKGSLLGNSSDATLMNSVEGGRFVFQAMKNQTYNTLLILDASTSTVQVGYNKPVDLSVTGQVTVNKTLRIASNNNTALSVAGGIAVKGIVSTGTLTVNSNTNLIGQVVVGSTIPFNTASIVPAANLYYDIGTPSRQFGTLYVNRINGNQFTGIAETANNLTNYRYFSINGQTTSTIYAFNGTQNISISTKLTAQAILQQRLRDNSIVGTDDRGNLTNIDRRDRILFSSGTSANAVLKQISKQDFTADLYDGRSINGQIIGNQSPFNDILPPGTIILWPSAVLPSSTSWVYCDGTTYLKDGPAFARLYSIIGNYYNDGTNTVGVNYKVPNIPGPTTGTYYIIKL